MKKKNEKSKLHYEPIGVTRWNLCQKLAQKIYRSEITEEEIFNQLDDIEKMAIINQK